MGKLGPINNGGCSFQSSSSSLSRSAFALPFHALQNFSSRPRVRRIVAAGCAVGVTGLASLSSRGLRNRNSAIYARKKGPESFGAPERRVTDVILGLNVLMFGLQWFTGQKLLLYGAKINELIVGGEYYRLLSAAFLHADFLHLGFNCNALHQLGPLVELASGHARFLVVYLGSAIAGTTMSFLCSPHMSIGASGAIFGVAGALAMFAWRHRDIMGDSADNLLKRLGDTAAINLMYGLIFRRIDNWGHFGGLVGGAVFSYLLGPNLVVRKTAKNQAEIVDAPPIPILAHRRQPQLTPGSRRRR